MKAKKTNRIKYHAGALVGGVQQLLRLQRVLLLLQRGAVIGALTNLVQRHLQRLVGLLGALGGSGGVLGGVVGEGNLSVLPRVLGGHLVRLGLGDGASALL